MGGPRPLGATEGAAEQRRGAATPMMSRIFWGRSGAGLQGRQRQDPRTRSYGI